MHNLIFFVFMIIVSCNNNHEQQVTTITIRWENKKATGVFIPSSLTESLPADSMQQLLIISLPGKTNTTPILGHYTVSNGVLFEPLLPFTAGLEYNVLVRHTKAGSFSVPIDTSLRAPSVIAFYPHIDTLPENLLKVYLEFSEPMREGQSNKYIKLVKDSKDTLQNVFLDLQPELWNEDRTVLTIWLDPGRIKRDLQPNLRMGPPLKAREKYRLVVDKHWQDAQGLPLTKDYGFSFVAGLRDSLSPAPDRWTLQLPQKNTRQPLDITPKEYLDYFLLQDCLQVENAGQLKVDGTFIIAKEGNHMQFIPARPWAAGKYALAIETKLEDLAGNNVNKPFDRDVLTQKKVSEEKVYRRGFEIK